MREAPYCAQRINRGTAMAAEQIRFDDGAAYEDFMLSLIHI